MARAKSSKLRLYGPRLLVTDFPASWRFYKDVLGLTPAKGHGEPPYGEFVWRGAAILGLFDRGLMAKATGLRVGRTSRSNVGASALILEVDDVDATAAKLRRRKVRLVKGPTNRPEWGLRTIHVMDPDGYLVEIESPLKAR